MRVLYDHQVTSLQDAGGISRYYFELVRAMLAANETEDVFRPELLLGLNRSIVPFDSMRPGARVVSMDTSVPPGPLRYALNELLSMSTAPLRGRFDVYHATYQRVLPVIHKSAVVVTHHDSTPDHFPDLFPNATAIHGRLKKVYERADRIICISESCRQDLLRFFRVDPEKTVRIHHGFSALPPESGIERGSLPCEQPFLLYVGSRAAYKNFSALLRAMAQQSHKDLHLVAAGGGAFRGDELLEISRLRLTERIHGLPRVTDEQLAALYRNATIFVYPSLYEGFGFPPLEAMSVGCPALVSHTPALLEICGDAAFYFDPASLEDLAASLARLLADDQFRRSKRQVGLAQVKQYTWQKAATETLAAYRAALGR